MNRVVRTRGQTLYRCTPAERTATAILPALLAAICVTGCTGLNTRTADGRPVRMSRDEFAAYTEETFRYHNRIVNDLITATSFGDESLMDDAALIRAEEHMAARCHSLNEMVTATIEGRELSLWKKIRLLESVPQCAAASRAVEDRLQESY